MPDWIVSLPERLDTFLVESGGFPSRARAQDSIEAGKVRVNDGTVKKPSFRLQEGDHVELTGVVVRAPMKISPVDLHFAVLYEDAACLVLAKPAGVAMHPGSGMSPEEVTVLHGIAHLLQDRGLPFSPEAVLVHRLDRETTGCLLVAKTPEAHRSLQEQFMRRTVTKSYLALVAGIPSPAAATIDSPIGRSASNRTKMAVSGAPETREAQTSFRTLAVSRNVALLLCELHTGRTHQIRVHLSAIGHPVLGDDTYSSPLAERLTQEWNIRSLCLHAWKLRFRSPADGRGYSAEAEVPVAFSEVLLRVGIPSEAAQ